MKNISQHILEKLQISRNKQNNNLPEYKISSVMADDFGSQGRRYYFWNLNVNDEIEGIIIAYPNSQVHKGIDPFLYLATVRYEYFDNEDLQSDFIKEIGPAPKTLFVPIHEFVKYAAHSLPEDAAKYLRKLLFFLGDEDTFFTQEYDRAWTTWEFYCEDNG